MRLRSPYSGKKEHQRVANADGTAGPSSSASSTTGVTAKYSVAFGFERLFPTNGKMHLVVALPVALPFAVFLVVKG